MKNKKILLSLLTVGVIASGVLFKTADVFADDNGVYSDIVSRISQKFGLQESEVQAVFDSVRDEHKEEAKQHFEDNLTSLVSEGKITEDQKNALIQKHTEMETNREDLSDLSHEERHQKMEQNRLEFENWAKEQGIDLSLIHPMKMGRGEGFGPMH